jgi:hypothetical protein
VNVPVACTLNSGEAQVRRGEWEMTLARAVATSERRSANRLELRLLADLDIRPVVDLAQREASCCAFFTFTLEIGADHLVLVIEVPDEAIEMLDHLVSLTTRA